MPNYIGDYAQLSRSLVDLEKESQLQGRQRAQQKSDERAGKRQLVVKGVELGVKTRQYLDQRQYGSLQSGAGESLLKKRAIKRDGGMFSKLMDIVDRDIRGGAGSYELTDVGKTYAGRGDELLQPFLEKNPGAYSKPESTNVSINQNSGSTSMKTTPDGAVKTPVTSDVAKETTKVATDVGANIPIDAGAKTASTIGTAVKFGGAALGVAGGVQNIRKGKELEGTADIAASIAAMSPDPIIGGLGKLYHAGKFFKSIFS